MSLKTQQETLELKYEDMAFLANDSNWRPVGLVVSSRYMLEIELLKGKAFGLYIIYNIPGIGVSPFFGGIWLCNGRVILCLFTAGPYDLGMQTTRSKLTCQE